MSDPKIGTEEGERIARELAEEFRRLRVEDLLIQTLVTVSSIGYRRLGLTEDTRADRNLEQAQLAIETMRTLTPLLEKFVPGELIRDFNQSVANLQLAYAKAASEASEASVADGSAEASAEESPPEGEQESGETETSRPKRDSPSAPPEDSTSSEAD